MFLPDEPLFLGGSDHFTVDEQSGRRVVAEGAGEAEDDHCRRQPIAENGVL
jgi:hypothetical protein